MRQLKSKEHGLFNIKPKQDSTKQKLEYAVLKRTETNRPSKNGSIALILNSFYSE